MYWLRLSLYLHGLHEHAIKLYNNSEAKFFQYSKKDLSPVNPEFLKARLVLIHV